MKKLSARFLLLIMVLTMLMSALGVVASAATTSTDPELAGEEWHKLLVNPWNKKPSGYSVKLSYVRGYQVDSRCASQLKKMLSACEKAGHEPLIISGYRSNSTQKYLYDRQVQRCISWGYSYSAAKKKAATSVAPPGTSEHQTGLAVDIVDMDYQALVNSQANTNTQKWLMKNCWKYGFILRYPKGTTAITGIIYEPWHYRYVGKTLAKEIHEAGITLEEYLGAVQPQNLSVSNNADSGLPVLKWDKVENAAKYSIYRSTSKNGTYKRIYTTKYLKYTDKKAEVGTKYYYYVKAVTPYGDVSKPSSKVARTCDLPRPVVSIGNAPATGKIKLSWDAIDGAVKYEIYRSNSRNGTYTKIYTTKKTSFANGSPQPGEAYYYRVKAIAQNTAANSALSVKKWRTCDLPRTSLNAVYDEGSKSVKLSWKSVDGAAKYRVYRSDSESGSYKSIWTGTELSFEDSPASGTVWYKVRVISDIPAANSADSLLKTVAVPEVTEDSSETVEEPSSLVA